METESQNWAVVPYVPPPQHQVPEHTLEMEVWNEARDDERTGEELDIEPFVRVATRRLEGYLAEARIHEPNQFQHSAMAFLAYLQHQLRNVVGEFRLVDHVSPLLGNMWNTQARIQAQVQVAQTAQFVHANRLQQESHQGQMEALHQQQALLHRQLAQTEVQLQAARGAEGRAHVLDSNLNVTQQRLAQVTEQLILNERERARLAEEVQGLKHQVTALEMERGQRERAEKDLVAATSRLTASEAREKEAKARETALQRRIDEGQETAQELAAALAKLDAEKEKLEKMTADLKAEKQANKRLKSEKAEAARKLKARRRSWPSRSQSQRTACWRRSWRRRT